MYGSVQTSSYATIDFLELLRLTSTSSQSTEYQKELHRRGVIWGIIKGTTIGVIKGDTRSLDYSSFANAACHRMEGPRGIAAVHFACPPVRDPTGGDRRHTYA